jgi:uncharacterized protein (DUF2237 family)
MLKRTLAVALSTAFLAATGALVTAPIERAQAEMLTAQPKEKSGMSGSERRKKCAAEWKEAKAAGKTAGQKWPKFYSECNKRLKGGG